MDDKNESVSLTRDMLDEKEAKINKKIDVLLPERDALIGNLDTATVDVKVNRKKLREAKKQFKLAKKEAKKILRAKIKEAKEEYKTSLGVASEPLNASKEEFNAAKDKKSDLALKLFEIRYQISYLQDCKEELEKQYISDKGEYISTEDLKKM